MAVYSSAINAKQLHVRYLVGLRHNAYQGVLLGKQKRQKIHLQYFLESTWFIENN